jgi:hypothetical protein
MSIYLIRLPNTSAKIIKRCAGFENVNEDALVLATMGGRRTRLEVVDEWVCRCTEKPLRIKAAVDVGLTL